MISFFTKMSIYLMFFASIIITIGLFLNALSEPKYRQIDYHYAPFFLVSPIALLLVSAFMLAKKCANTYFLRYILIWNIVIYFILPISYVALRKKGYLDTSREADLGWTKRPLW